MEAPAIVLVRERIEPSGLRRLTQAFFVDMVQVVVDVGRGVAAVGGEMHVDGADVLLDDAAHDRRRRGGAPPHPALHARALRTLLRLETGAAGQVAFLSH
jgi:hypothetical protein